MRKVNWSVLLALAGLLPCAMAEQASTNETNLTAKDYPRFAAAVNYSYVGEGDTKFRGNNHGKSDAHGIAPAIFGEVPVNQEWYIPMSASSDIAFLDTVQGAPTPDRIEVMRLATGVGYHFNQKWDASLVAGPMFYDLENVEGRTLGFSAVARTVYRMNETWTFAAGLVVSPDSDVPVFPAAGVIWNINPQWTLNIMAPKPRVIYKASDSLQLYAGVDVRYAVFRTDDSIREKTGVSGFNNALGTYRDVRLGVGAEYEFIKGFSGVLEAGYSVGRQIDYTRIDERVKYDPSPYLQAGVKYSF